MGHSRAGLTKGPMLLFGALPAAGGKRYGSIVRDGAFTFESAWTSSFGPVLLRFGT